MDIKTLFRNPKNQQYVLEILFPILGYFFWDWTLLIIVSFYILDYLASQIMYTRRLYFISEFKEQKTLLWMVISIFAFIILFITTLGLLQFTFDKLYLLRTEPYITELITFAKDELWFLFPVILLSYYMMDKLFFFVPRRFTNYQPKSYLIKNAISNTIATSIISVGCLVAVNYVVSDLVIIFSIILVKLGFDFGIKKRVLKIDI